MGHNIEHYDYDEKVNKSAVFSDLDRYVRHATWQEGGSGIEPIKWNDVVCENYEEAEKWIERHDRTYDSIAVKYKEPLKNQPSTEKQKELQQKLNEAHTNYWSKANALYVKTRTSEFIGCGNCKSKLASKYLNSNYCPVCRADLRPETTQKSIAAAKEKLHRATVALDEYVSKHSKKEIRWLVKIEYHT